MVTASTPLFTAPCFDWQSDNLTSELEEFRQYSELAFTGPLEGTNDNSKLAYILLWLGRDVRQIYNAWDA